MNNMNTSPTISELRVKFVAGTYTPLDAYRDARAIIDANNVDINAYLEVFDDAEESAKAATERYAKEGERAPALLGMPIAVKNNMLVKGKRATAGSKILENYIATYDATVIARLKEAGAVIMGATNMDEFAMGSSGESSAYGITKNPLDRTRVPGGSSSGSAAALALGGIVAAVGTDTGGSVRQPAAFCGLVGVKPTYGTASRYGLVAMGSSLDQAGAFARTVADAALVQGIMNGKDINDGTTIDENTFRVVSKKDTYTIGVPMKLLDGVDADVRTSFEAKIEALKAAGNTVVDVDLPLFEKGLAAYYIVMPAEVSSNLARYDGIRYGKKVVGKDLLDSYMKTRAEGFGAEVKRRILLGTYVLSSGYYDAFYGKAEAARDVMRKELATTFETVDAILTPTSPIPAWKFGEKSKDPLSMYLADVFTVPVNLTGVPAMSVPAGTVTREESNLPVGIQIICPHAGEDRMYDIGTKIESL
ncbi:glutaminyl-tRNA synthase (glutamine-hydrolyzing) subunit A [Candidatus Kaiserbacteria bacterium RIFCSPHIGHO2_02_FULL_49_34]|uniref:Glutamyl-tRNA(Gln) amidotransferase subunit A n=1 Tax=Candidatus Kaiserbacteria bacterium RIFCSPHIGHO2_02_FULL_49_34 TaxID=1798491 RepID=A0A1F6DLT6_9BACT|nr:MAG: glutaminyl-tRNA synthase (glutamine-hydrolyzing) subunit A [Candidatus Kaiserbacteria bacterium RIFCSPHIGHO2_02_FULL_49_34]